MRYEIKIDEAEEAKGTIDLERLAAISEGIRKISEGALQLRLRGISVTKGRKKVSFEKALKVTLTGIHNGSTILDLECEPFEKTLEPFQIDAFRQEAQLDIPKQTPVSIFVMCFQDAMAASGSKELLDKQLLNELQKFKNVFRTDKEIFTVSNQGSIPDLKLQKNDFNKIKTLDEETPESESVLLNGRVELLQYSKHKVRIETSQGNVDGFLSDEIEPEGIAKYWGKEVTVAGTIHYKPGGKSAIEIERVFEPQEGDAYFSKKIKSETVEQQVERQMRERNFQNHLPDIIGKWPGDEDFDDLVKLLTK